MQFTHGAIRKARKALLLFERVTRIGIERCSFFKARHRFRWLELAAIGAGQRVRDLLPVFDNAGFNKLPPPASRMIKPQKNWRFPRLLSSFCFDIPRDFCVWRPRVSSHFSLEIDFRGLRMMLPKNYLLMRNIFVNLILSRYSNEKKYTVKIILKSWRRRRKL